MNITKGDKTFRIPGWALIIGALVVDNIVVNVCNTINYKNYSKVISEVDKNEEA